MIQCWKMVTFQVVKWLASPEEKKSLIFARTFWTGSLNHMNACWQNFKKYTCYTWSDMEWNMNVLFHCCAYVGQTEQRYGQPNKQKACSHWQSLQGRWRVFALSHFFFRRLLSYTQQQVYDVVSQVQHYARFVPWCRSSSVLSRSGTSCVAELVVGFPPVTERYTSHVTLRRPSLVKVSALRSSESKGPQKLFQSLF